MIDRFNDVMEFRSSLSPETDRGCALMAASFLDSELGDLLRSYVVDDRSVADEVFGQARPLGTFSSRIDASYLLGLISANARHDLHLIRKIRNDFGHVHRPLTFEDQSISNRCRELSLTFRNAGDPPRKHFISSAVAILALLHTAMNKRSRITSRAEPDLAAAKGRQSELVAMVKQALEEASEAYEGDA